MRTLKIIGINLAVVVLFLIALFTSNTLTGKNVQNWLPNSIGAVVVSILGLLLSLRLTAKWAAPFMMISLGYTVTRLVIYSIFGHAAAQGATTHFAVLLAVSLGVALGWYFFSKGRPHPPDSLIT